MIKVGPINYKIEEVEDLRKNGEKLDGNIEYGESVIYLEASLGEFTKRQVLWHEVLHIVLTHSGRREHSDPVIETLAYGIMGVLQDNPSLR